jgi:hypothetical protein
VHRGDGAEPAGRRGCWTGVGGGGGHQQDEGVGRVFLAERVGCCGGLEEGGRRGGVEG